jgi:peptidyl-Lys metalloendopeptidase
MINNTWKHLLFATAGLLAIPLAHSSAGPQKLEAVLSHPSSSHDADAGFITITVTNKSNNALFLPRPGTPLEDPDGHLYGLIFQIKNDAGEEVKFVGRFVNVRPASIDGFYIRIEPGQSLSKEINLSADYDLSKGGNFKVVYDQPYAGEVHMSEGEAVSSDATTVRSNELDIWVSSSLAIGAKDISFTPLSTSAPGLPEGCDATQTYTAFMAKLAASIRADDALGYLEDLYTVETIHHEDGINTYRPHMKPDFKYTYWFGQPDDNTEEFDHIPSYTSVWEKTDFYPLKVMDAVTMRAGSLNSTYICGCKSNYAPTTAAWADQSQPYLVHLCDFFFNLDANSQAETFVHEWSHFSDVNARTTIDHAQGRQQSHALASSNRAFAGDNGDTYGLFSQDVAKNPEQSESLNGSAMY